MKAKTYPKEGHKEDFCIHFNRKLKWKQKREIFAVSILQEIKLLKQKREIFSIIFQIGDLSNESKE